jgi:hypothetical protein
MLALPSSPRFPRLGSLLFGASLALGGCAGRSSSHSDDGGTGNTSGTAAGGTTGGTSSGSAGTSGTGKGGGSLGGSGGSGAGGTTDPGKGGTGIGGTTDPGKGGTAGCANETCPSIPNTCSKIVQHPDECCPVCLDTGCPSDCEEPACKEGQHIETLPGDCCPTCVADPPDACETGQEIYADLKTALLEKYGSSSCKNSSECTIVYELNACVATCGVALPTSTAMSYSSNLENYAAGCETCDPPQATPCPASVAACVNGKCVATGP